MALEPDITYPDDSIDEVEPSKTFKLDLNTGEITSVFIDENEAIKQFIHKSIQTVRYQCEIYSDDVGCEAKSLFGQDFSDEFIQSEMERMIREALIYDERIDDVDEFTISLDDDKAFVSFTVHTSSGDVIPIDEEVS